MTENDNRVPDEFSQAQALREKLIEANHGPETKDGEGTPHQLKARSEELA